MLQSRPAGLFLSTQDHGDSLIGHAQSPDELRAVGRLTGGAGARKDDPAGAQPSRLLGVSRHRCFRAQGCRLPQASLLDASPRPAWSPRLPERPARAGRIEGRRPRAARRWCRCRWPPLLCRSRRRRPESASPLSIAQRAHLSSVHQSASRGGRKRSQARPPPRRRPRRTLHRATPPARPAKPPYKREGTRRLPVPQGPLSQRPAADRRPARAASGAGGMPGSPHPARAADRGRRRRPLSAAALPQPIPPG